MADPKYQYSTQNNFTGGISTEPELRRVSKSGEVTVAEAADVWAPNGVLKRRPGVYEIGTTTSFSTGALEPDSLVGAYFLATATGVVYNSTTSGSPPNRFITVPNATPGFIYLPFDISLGITEMSWPFPYKPGSATFIGAVWTPDGVLPHVGGQNIDYRIPTGIDSIDIGPSASQVTNGTCWAIVGFTTVSTNIALSTYNGGAGNYEGLEGTAASYSETLLGSHFAPLPTGSKYLQLATGSAGTVINLRNSSTFFTSAIGNNVTPNPALFTRYGAAPSWATVVDANRVYVAYANQVYEYRPELATPFRLAQVNSNDLVTGPGASFDKALFAQWPQFPAANQVIYFNGLLFMTDIKGNPNVVQWGGPAIDGAVDVLPVLSYAILSDSRDNSKNVGFGVYNANLYVFKQNSIWSLIPAGQSEVDGSYLFTSRLVTSGAGCSAPGSIVSTPEGIIFYNSGGFYIFNGQSTEKLTSPVKQLFDAIVPGNAYQMQAAHWPQQHSYVVTCQMAHPWPSDVFEDLPQIFNGTLCYDYQNNAWWLWLSVSGKALYMDAYGNFITQDYYNEFRILDPNKEYDSDALAKSTATPYIKTQRFGYGESLQKQYRELRLTGEIDNLNVETSVEINDQVLAATDYDITFIPVDYDIVPLGTLIPDGDPYSPPWGRFEQPIEVQNDGQWAQVRVNGSYGPFTVYNLNLGYYVEGRNG